MTTIDEVYNQLVLDMKKIEVLSFEKKAEVLQKLFNKMNKYMQVLSESSNQLERIK